MTRCRKHPASPRSASKLNGEMPSNVAGFGTDRLLCFSLSGTEWARYFAACCGVEQGIGGRHEKELVVWGWMNAGNLTEGGLQCGRGGSISCPPVASCVMRHSTAVCRRASARRPPRDSWAGISVPQRSHYFSRTGADRALCYLDLRRPRSEEVPASGHVLFPFRGCGAGNFVRTGRQNV